MRALLLVLLVLVAGCATTPTQVTENPVETCGALEADYAVDERLEPYVRFVTSEGEFTVAVYLQEVPVTAGNFLSLVNQGFYNDTRFHLLRANELVQGGDPLTTSPNKQFWGTGGPGYQIPDEFHQFLRHDAPGILSMANSGPNSGGSQFMIHLRPRPDLDDRNPVFGRVIEGLEVVQRLSRTPVDDRERPQFNAELLSARILPPEGDPSEAAVSLTSFGFDCHQVAEPGTTAEFLVVVRNTGHAVLNGTFAAETPAGWEAALRNTRTTVAVPAGQSVAYIIDARVPEDAPATGTETVRVSFTDKESDATTALPLVVELGELGQSARPGDEIAVDYVGVLEDGRPFDTTHREYLRIPFLSWFKPPPSHDAALEPLTFTVGDGRLISGFDRLADRSRVGESVTGAIPPGEGYGDGVWGQNGLGGRLLIFQLEPVRVV